MNTHTVPLPTRIHTHRYTYESIHVCKNTHTYTSHFAYILYFINQLISPYFQRTPAVPLPTLQQPSTAIRAVKYPYLNSVIFTAAHHDRLTL